MEETLVVTSGRAINGPPVARQDGRISQSLDEHDEHDDEMNALDEHNAR